MIGPVLSILHDAFQISKTACGETNDALIEQGVNTNELYNCDDALFAPQAEQLEQLCEVLSVGTLIYPCTSRCGHRCYFDKTCNASDERCNRDIFASLPVGTNHGWWNHLPHFTV